MLTGGATSSTILRAIARNSAAANPSHAIATGRPASPPAATAGSSGTRPSSSTPISSARTCPPPVPNSAYSTPCSQVNDDMFSITPHTRRKLRRAMSAARAATFCAAIAGVVTISRSVRGSIRANPICTSPVPGGMSMNR